MCVFDLSGYEIMLIIWLGFVIFCVKVVDFFIFVFFLILWGVFFESVYDIY